LFSGLCVAPRSLAIGWRPRKEGASLNGLPYEFASGEESGPVEANVSSPTAIIFGAIGPQHAFTDGYPAANALVTFK
jgi:hypothetical protein